MKSWNNEDRIAGVHIGKCVEAGTSPDTGEPSICIETTIPQLMGGRNLVYEEVAVMREDELIVGEIVGFDAEANQITFKLEDLRATGAIVGARWVLRFNPA